jgi:hypothetical protein
MHKITIKDRTHTAYPIFTLIGVDTSPPYYGATAPTDFNFRHREGSSMTSDYA